MSVVQLKQTKKFSVFSLEQGDEDENEAAHERYLRLTKAVDYELARNTSRLERAALPSPDAPNLTYGEVEFNSLAVVFDYIRQCGGLEEHRSDLVFVDLGSGCGRPLIAAGLLYPQFRQLIGIEILEGLHKLALNMKEAWDAQEDRAELGEVEFIHGSLLDHEWPECADVILANSTCFSIPFFAQIEAQAQACRPGTFFISLTHCLDTKGEGHWELLETLRLEMSWGAADVCIHVRR